MKKIVSILLVMALCFAMCACGKTSDNTTETEPNPYEKYARYEELFNYLEDGNYEKADAYLKKHFNVEETEAKEEEIIETEAPNTPSFRSVEITIDNWQEYFELRTHYKFEVNGFGEFECVDAYYLLTTKDGIVPDVYNCDVTFEYQLVVDTKQCSVDFENRTVDFGATTWTYNWDPTVETMNGMGQYMGEFVDNRYGEYLTSGRATKLDGDSMNVLVDFIMMRIAGTITIAE